MIGKFRVVHGYQWSDGLHARGDIVLLEDPGTIAQLLTAGRLEPADSATAAAIKWSSPGWSASKADNDPRWLGPGGVSKVATRRKSTWAPAWYTGRPKLHT